MSEDKIKLSKCHLNLDNCTLKMIEKNNINLIDEDYYKYFHLSLDEISELYKEEVNK